MPPVLERRESNPTTAFSCRHCSFEAKAFLRQGVQVRKFLTLFFTLCVALTSLTAQTEKLKLATTTSTENSGLLSVLIPLFEKTHGLRVDIIAVGTGKALKLGENGDVDVLMVHAPAAEMSFVEQGYGVNRRQVMHNDFIIVGSSSDPAGVRGKSSAASALNQIAVRGRLFISRGDDSGTHKLEMQLWKSAATTPGGKWYKEAGQGMGAVLTMADYLQAYTLTDRGTFLSMRDKLNLDILVEKDPDLYNQYSVIAVNPALHAHVNYRGALEFISWVTSAEARNIMTGFKIGGEQLFYPCAAE